jgi:hypothetical protein
MNKQERLNEAVDILSKRMQSRFDELRPSRREIYRGLDACFELIQQPWDYPQQTDPIDGYERIWHEGYEQCMVDFVDALADEWGVSVWAEAGADDELEDEESEGEEEDD